MNVAFRLVLLPIEGGLLDVTNREVSFVNALLLGGDAGLSHGNSRLPQLVLLLVLRDYLARDNLGHLQSKQSLVDSQQQEHPVLPIRLILDGPLL